MNQPQIDYQFTLDAGTLSLDFANTLDDRRGPQPEELLPDYAALVGFAQQAGFLDNISTRRLEELADIRQHEARAIHASALVLREAIFRTGFAVASDQSPDPDDLRVIQSSLVDALSHGGLSPDDGAFTWSWDAAGSNLERPLWPIAYAAFELITHEDLSRLRVCAADDCDWLFLDESRNRSRKWCAMNTCGNRAKVARYRGRRGRDQ